MPDTRERREASREMRRQNRMEGVRMGNRHTSTNVNSRAVHCSL